MSSRSLNKVMLIGNLTRDPELRYTPQGTAVASFGVATNRNWVGSDGQRQESAEFHNIVAWSKLGELCDQLLRKGSKVYVSGRLQTRDWVGDDGKKRYKTETVIDQMILLGGGKAWDSSKGSSKPSSDKSVDGNGAKEAENDSTSISMSDEEVDLDEILADTDFDLEEESSSESEEDK